MAIPTLQKFFLPVLKSIGKRNISSIREVEEDMKTHFNFSEEQMQIRVRNRTKTVVYDRVTWAMTYLFQAGLIEKNIPGHRSITEAGRQVLSQNPNSLTWRDLRSRQNQEDSRAKKPPSDAEYQFTNERLEAAFEEMKKEVLKELLKKVKKIHPRSFEELVLELLKKMGYGHSKAGFKHTGGPGDGGVDGVIFQDALGCYRIYIQAKRYNDATTVGRPEIQRFRGALSGRGSKQGIFITTSSFTSAATEEAKKNPSLVLIDGDKFVELLYQYNVGVKIENVFEYKTVDESFFADL